MISTSGKDAVDDAVARLDAIIELLSQARDGLRETEGLALILRDVRRRLPQECEDPVRPIRLQKHLRR